MTWKYVYNIILCFIILNIAVAPAYAKCSAKDRIELGKQGYTKEEVNQICEEEDSSSDTDEGTTKGSKRKPKRDDSENDLKWSPPAPLYCCDAFGNRRCVIVTGSGPLGSPCWCSGVPGTGVTCQ